MNKDKLKSIISKKSNGDNNLSAQLYQMYFFEHILDRLSKSKYKNNIILKGGLLLSSIIGDDERTTKDMDATLKSIPLEKENIENIIQEILNIDMEDGISYEIVNIKDIRLDSEYGGFKINILSKMESLKVYLAIELTTGDKITPREVEYNYNCIFEDKKISILAYNLETIIAEKYQTIISRGIYNTRMKDFYDIYILITYKKEQLNLDNLNMAIKNTFKYRETKLNIEDIRLEIEMLKNNDNLIRLWKNYQVTDSYSNYISFESLFEAIDYITNILI